MKLYLVHHGDALPREQDPERPLSPKGTADLERMGIFLSRNHVVVERVLHSDKRRAIQTARILAARLAPELTLETRAGIQPDDPIDALAAEIPGWQRSTLVAGHGPFFSRLIPRLTTGSASPEWAATVPGTVFCLEPGEGTLFRLCWMVRPDLLG